MEEKLAFGSPGDISVGATFRPLLLKKQNKVKIHHCGRCEYEWAGRRYIEKPKCCPACKSPYWNKKRVRRKYQYKEAMG